jgi:HAE1 family hydrophobic/amphiphilic exporter-1
MDIVEARMNIVGFSLLNNINGGSTFLRNQIKRLEERTEDGQSVDAVETIICQDRKYERCENIITPPSIRELMDLN